MIEQNLAEKFGTFDKEPLWQMIARRLMTLLKEKQLKAGDKLPPERELAAMMQVSRPSLREGLRALSMMNVLEIRQGDGTYVTSLDPELLVEQLSLVLALDDSTLLQLFEARKIIEVGIIGLAAKRITDDDIGDLKANLARSEQAVVDPTTFLEVDVDLHKKITEIAQNPILTRIFDSVNQLGRASRTRTTELDGIREQSLEDHKAIVAALEAKDSDAAQAAMLQHLNNVQTKLVASLRGDMEK